MSEKIQLLDCTLRDGAYIVDAQFGTVAIKGIINKLEDANVEVIECGWLKNNEHLQGTSYYHVPDDLRQYLPEKKKDVLYTVMIDWDRYDLSFLPECDGRSVDAIRVIFPYGKLREGIEVGKKIREKGYQIFFQAANTLAYTDEDLIELADEVNKAEPIALSVVDTFGAMYEEDLHRIVRVLDKHLKTTIQLGFHSHNNQQLSFALTMSFVEMLKGGQRGIIVDASLCGMGRGAGNATTELVASYLNRKCGGHYDLDAVMDAIDMYMGYFQEKYRWGYSTPYFIAGMYCCHVNNIAYLLDNHRTNAKDMRNIIESLSPDERKKYDYDVLEQKYLKNQNRYVDDTITVQELKNRLRGRNVLLVAPGKTALTRRAEIQQYIDNSKAVVIGINAFVSDYNYDYVFFVNPLRYDYARNAVGDRFEFTDKIVLSNIKTEAENNEFIVGFNNVIKRGWKYFDNAAICCLRLMDYLGIEKVAICGFDGFKNEYNESYADPHLPSVNPGVNWEHLNEEIKEMFQDYKRSAVTCHQVDFLTESIFDC